jgi:hypothetical protein
MSKGVYLQESKNSALKCYVIDSLAAYTPWGIGGTELRGGGVEGYNRALPTALMR